MGSWQNISLIISSCLVLLFAETICCLHGTTTLTSVVSVFLRFVFGIISALYVSLSITIQIDKAFAVVVYSWKFLCWIFLHIVRRQLHWSVWGGSCVVWKKEWEELNVCLGKVSVRIVYCLFHICAFCYCGFWKSLLEMESALSSISEIKTIPVNFRETSD